VNAESLAWLSQQDATGVLLLTEEGSKKSAAEYLGSDIQAVGPGTLVIPIGLLKP
jgi:hypothetical protein